MKMNITGSRQEREFKRISIIIPTLNSASTLESCLSSIKFQDYPHDLLEVLIVDGGSSDDTLKIAEKYQTIVLDNPLKTAEAGKSVGLSKAKGEIIAFIDSDNILQKKEWFQKMLLPFSDPEIVGTEPLYYTYRKEDGYITRYCALLGMNDPLCLFLGNYDRYSILSEKWTGMNVLEEDKGEFIKIKLEGFRIPTIGANGFLIRKEMLEKCLITDYLFDIDIIYELIQKGYVHYAKVKIGIIHVFSGTLSKFIKKQTRRIRDYSYYTKLNMRKYPWAELNKKRLFKFILYTILIFPLIGQVIIGMSRKRDNAWLFHIPACWLTLLIYGNNYLKKLIIAEKPVDRNNW